MKLSDTKVRALKPQEREYKVADGAGLTLVVTPSGAKVWRLRYRRPGGRAAQASLGQYPVVTLAMAREKTLEAKRLIAEGGDPITDRQKEVDRTFATAARAFVTMYRASWAKDHCARVTNRLELDVIPAIGQMDVDDIRQSDIRRAVQGIFDRGSIDTAKRTISVIGQVLDMAIDEEERPNPARSLRRRRASLPPTPATRHQPALTREAELGPFLDGLWEWKQPTLGKPLVQLAMLTFARLGELLAMRWDEIDTGRAEWTYTVSKVNLAGHFVPLSKQALEVLEGLRPITGRFDHVFAHPGHGKPISAPVGMKLIGKLGYKDRMTIHGARAVARTLLVGRLGVPVEQVELQLSHAPKDVHGRAYDRVEWLTERAAMMQLWADHLDRLRRAARAERLGIASAPGDRSAG
jgi:integrase